MLKSVKTERGTANTRPRLSLERKNIGPEILGSDNIR